MDRLIEALGRAIECYRRDGLKDLEKENPDLYLAQLEHRYKKNEEALLELYNFFCAINRIFPTIQKIIDKLPRSSNNQR